MRLSSWLISLTFLSTCVSAFYPYKVEDVTSTSKSGKGKVKGRRFIPWIQEDGFETGESNVPTLSIKKGHSKVKRDNKYPVVMASQPSMPNSMAVEEDGQDYSYFSVLKFGSSSKELWMLIDTGAANTWIMGSDCTSKSCLSHNTFGNTDSNTLKVTKTPWNVSYGTGTVSGVLVNDTISLAGFKVDMSFGSASITSDDFLNYPMDGILGLGRPQTSGLGVPTVMELLANAKLLKANLFGVHLQRNSDGATDGEINFGALDTSKFDGQVAYTKTVSVDGLWEIPADDAGVGGKGCKFTGKTAILDTGTSYIMMPPDDAKTLHNQIPNVQQNGENFIIPCSTTVPIQFTFSGVTYNISSKDYLAKPDSTGECISNIVGHQAFGANQWLLGDVFLKNVYTVFDFDKDRIGFGVKGTSASSQTSPSAASSSQSIPIPTPAAATASLPPSSSSEPISSAGHLIPPEASSPTTAAPRSPSTSKNDSKGSPSDSKTSASTAADSTNNASPLNGLGSAATRQRPAFSLIFILSACFVIPLWI